MSDPPIRPASRATGHTGTPTQVIENLAACSNWPSRWSDQLDQVQPTDVLLVLGFPALEDEQVDGAWLEACGPEWRAFMGSEMVQAVDLLGSTGANVWVASVVPPDPTIFGEELEQRTECLNRVLRDAVDQSSAHAATVDLEGYLCPRRGESCLVEIDGEALRTDFVHYVGPGGRAVAIWLVEHMTARST